MFMQSTEGSVQMRLVLVTWPGGSHNINFLVIIISPKGRVTVDGFLLTFACSSARFLLEIIIRYAGKFICANSIM